MPLFEYECQKCGATTEFLENAFAEGEHNCEKCGSSQTHKVMSASAVNVPKAIGSCGKSACPTGGCPFA